MILMITIIVLTISVFGTALIKTKKPMKAFIIAGAFSMLASLGYALGGAYLLSKAEDVTAVTEVALDKVDNSNNYVIYDSTKGVYYYKEKEGQLLKEVPSKDASVSEEKQGKETNTVVRKRITISNEFLYFIYKGSNYESKIVVEFKVADGGLTIQQ